MNLKPFRQYSENDVINLFAPNFTSGDKGSLVTVADGFVSSDEATNVAIEGMQVANYVVNYRRVVPAQVRLSTSGEGKGDVLGMMLYNVRSTNFLGVNLLFDRARREEGELAISGDAMPVVKRGFFLVAGFTGTPGAGSGAVTANGGAGAGLVTNGRNAKDVGEFLGAPDTDGYALFYLNV